MPPLIAILGLQGLSSVGKFLAGATMLASFATAFWVAYQVLDSALDGAPMMVVRAWTLSGASTALSMLAASVASAIATRSAKSLLNLVGRVGGFRK